MGIRIQELPSCRFNADPDPKPCLPFGVPAPDPPGFEIFWPQGSGSEIISFGSGSGSGSFPYHTKLRNIFKNAKKLNNSS